MAVDLTTVPPIGQGTRLSDYVRLLDNIKEAAGAYGGVGLPLGGSLKDFISSTSPVDLDDGWEWEIDGTHLGACDVYLEVNAKRGPDGLGGSVTVTLDLWNITSAGVVASSAVAVALTTTARTYQKSVALTLPTSIVRVKARGSVTDSAKPCAAVGRLLIRGS